MKEIKLFLVNYQYTVDYYGEERQKEVHRILFDNVLNFKHNGVILQKIYVRDIGVLHFVESTDTEDHLVLKYFLKVKGGDA